jgi:WD40-like Beta Propeller Repeat
MPVIASAPDRSLFQAQFSPDERLICFNAIMRPPDRPRKSTIQVAPVSGGPWVAVTSGEFWDDKPRWSPDGRIIYYASLRNGFFNIWGRRFDQTQGRPLGEPFRVTEFERLEHTIFPDVSRMHFAVSSDRLMLPMRTCRPECGSSRTSIGEYPGPSRESPAQLADTKLETGRPPGPCSSRVEEPEAGQQIVTVEQARWWRRRESNPIGSVFLTG